MNKNIYRITKNDLFFLLILIIHQILVLWVVTIFPVVHFTKQNLFFIELIGNGAFYSAKIIFVIELGNLILLWLIGKKIFKGRYSLLLPLLWTVCPWAIYETVAKSFYIYIVFLLLVGILSFLNYQSKKTKLNLAILAGSLILGIYSSFFVFLLSPFFFLLLKKRVLLLLLIPLIFLILNNSTGFKNIAKNEITIFADPGFVNMINRDQGQANKVGLGKLARVTENKYIFGLEKLGLKFTQQLLPETYFSFQNKLLNFSFSPPIYLGFLIPFIYGLIAILKNPFLKKWLMISNILVIPSVLSGQAADLNRLLIFAPVIILIISYGLMILIEKFHHRTDRKILLLAIFLITFQFLVTVTDIHLKERNRFEKYQGIHFDLGKQ